MVPVVLAAIAAVAFAAHPASSAEVAYFEVPRGAHPHDVAPAPDGRVWYTAQFQGALGILNPKTGQTTQIALGVGSAPHGVIVGPDRAAWITDGGQNAIFQRKAMGKLDWLVVKDNFETETAAFWRTAPEVVNGEVDPAEIPTEVFFFPSAQVGEMDGSFTNKTTFRREQCRQLP